MSKITLQQIIDAAWQKFIVEDAPPALAADGRCVYRTKDGRACAVGLCIPDGHAALAHKGAFPGLAKAFPELFDTSVFLQPLDMLAYFQSALHDGQCDATGWLMSRAERAERYKEIACRFGLTLPNGGVLPGAAP